jgi:uncharacterized protein
MKFLRRSLKIALILLSIYAFGLWLLYIEQESIIFHPTKLPKNHEYSFEEPFEELFLRAHDGKKINALYFPVSKPKGVVLVFHGNSGDLQTCGSDAKNYTRLVYDVLMPDYRSFGKSQSALSEANLYADALSCYDFLLLRRWKGKQITIFGMSLGTGMATYVAAHRPHRQLLLYAPYWSMKRLAQEKYPFVPDFVLKFPLESHRYLRQVKTPVYIFHGTLDGTIPVEQARELFELTTQKGKLLILKGGRHNDLASFPEYQQVLGEALR